MGRKTRTLKVLRDLAVHLEAYVTGQPPPMREYRVEQRVEQRVTDVVQNINPLLFQRVMDTPSVPNANNPTSKQVMHTKVQTHKKKTQGNTLGALPLIMRPNIIEQLTKQLTVPTVPLTKHLRIIVSHNTQAKASNVATPRQSTCLHGLEP
jgi:hypothetical protein